MRNRPYVVLYEKRCRDPFVSFLDPKGVQAALARPEVHQGEIENVSLYDRALESTYCPDILAVYQALRSAPQDRHLSAFQRLCATLSRAKQVMSGVRVRFWGAFATELTAVIGATPGTKVCI